MVVAGLSNQPGTIAAALLRLDDRGILDTQLKPVDTLGGTVGYVEGSPAIVLDPDAKIFDLELNAIDNYANATLTILRNGGAAHG